MPSVRVSSFAYSSASSSLTVSSSSTREMSITSGMSPSPMPWISWGRETLPARIAAFSGSMAAMRMEGLCSFR